ncbi:MAG: hypothetical protein U0Q12_19840 [Vicinamibacterales bacterium]
MRGTAPAQRVARQAKAAGLRVEAIANRGVGRRRIMLLVPDTIQPAV